MEVQMDSTDPTGLDQDAIKMFKRLGIQPSRGLSGADISRQELEDGPLTGEEESMLPPCSAMVSKLPI